MPAPCCRRGSGPWPSVREATEDCAIIVGVPGDLTMHNPFVPETLEGWGLLHQAFRIRWSSIRALSPTARVELAAEAAAALKLGNGDGNGVADSEPDGGSIL